MTILFDRVPYKDLPKDLKQYVYQKTKDYINSHYAEQKEDCKADRKEVMEYINDHVYTFIEHRDGSVTMETDGSW